MWGVCHKYIEWYREHPVEDDLKMLQWSDEKLDGKGYIDWYSVEHPQLGTVELGGWDLLYAWRNPPAKYLEAEVAPLVDWAIWHLQISPRLELVEATTTPLGNDNHHIKLVVQNTGWLPSAITQTAIKNKLVRGLVTEIELPDGATLKSGKLREEHRQLDGRAYSAISATPWSVFGASSGDRLLAEWVVTAPNGGTVNLVAKHDRAGTVRARLELQ